jgi:hypothetical protein
MIGLRSERYKLIHYPAMKKAYQWELFDLLKDADEMENQYRNSEYREVREMMETRLRKVIVELGDPVQAPALMH